MSTEETQRGEAEEVATEETQRAEETTIEQDIETNLKGEEEQVDIEVTDEEVEAELEAAQREKLEPPHMWDKRYREAFEEMGSLENGHNFQKAMLDLYQNEQQYKTQIEQERAHLRKFAQPLQEVVEQYRDLFNAAGSTPDQMIRQSLGLMTQLRRNPRETILGLAQRAGIDLTQLGDDAPYVDPKVQELEGNFRRLQAEYQQREQRRAQEQAIRIQQDIQQQLNAFTGATDERGKPKYPHVGIVENDMAMLIRGNPQLSLEDAYHRACKLSDEVAQAEESRKQAEEAARKAAKAKKEQTAAKRVSGKPGVDAPPEEDQEETIRKIWRQSQQAA